MKHGFPGPCLFLSTLVSGSTAVAFQSAVRAESQITCFDKGPLGVMESTAQLLVMSYPWNRNLHTEIQPPVMLQGKEHRRRQILMGGEKHNHSVISGILDRPGGVRVVGGSKHKFYENHRSLEVEDPRAPKSSNFKQTKNPKQQQQQQNMALSPS